MHFSSSDNRLVRVPLLIVRNKNDIIIELLLLPHLEAKVIFCMISHTTSPFFGEDDRCKLVDSTTNITNVWNNDNNSANNGNILASLFSEIIYVSTSSVGNQDYVFE